MSLQLRLDLPLASVCIAQAWTDWLVTMVVQHISVCPVWTKLSRTGSPTPENVAQNILTLPALPDSNPDTVVPFGKEQFLYAVRLPVPSAAPATVQDGPVCAKACTGGLAGFFVGQSGDNIVGDPYWWVDPNDYGSNSPYGPPVTTTPCRTPMTTFRERSTEIGRAAVTPAAGGTATSMCWARSSRTSSSRPIQDLDEQVRLSPAAIDVVVVGGGAKKSFYQTVVWGTKDAIIRAPCVGSHDVWDVRSRDGMRRRRRGGDRRFGRLSRLGNRAGTGGKDGGTGGSSSGSGGVSGASGGSADASDR